METPYFLLDTHKLVENYTRFAVLAKKLEKARIAYSVKTNSHEKVISILGKLGCGMEVASEEEIKFISKIKERKFVVFNGAGKTEKELRLAVKNKFLINVDSKSEIDKIADIVAGKGKISIRVALDEGKFGIESNKIMKAIHYAGLKKLRVVGLSFHGGTQKNINGYRENLERFSKLVEKLYSIGIKLEYIDVGGGFPDKVQLENLGLRLEDYFDIIKNLFSHFKAEIVLEPGRVLVADIMTLYTKVIAIKQNFGKRYAILDAGINILSKITLANYRFSKIKKEKISQDKPKQEYILAGPLLFSNDIFGRYVGNLEEGDIIKIENVGAYCYNLAWELSYKKPGIKIQ